MKLGTKRPWPFIQKKNAFYVIACRPLLQHYTRLIILKLTLVRISFHFCEERDLMQRYKKLQWEIRVTYFAFWPQQCHFQMIDFCRMNSRPKKKLQFFFSTYPISFANSTCVFHVTSPSKAQSSTFEITISEHISQTKSIIVFLWKKKLNDEKKNGANSFFHIFIKLLPPYSEKWRNAFF